MSNEIQALHTFQRKPQTNIIPFIIPLFDTVAEISRSNLPVIAGPFFPYDVREAQRPSSSRESLPLMRKKWSARRFPFCQPLQLLFYSCIIGRIEPTSSSFSPSCSRLQLRTPYFSKKARIFLPSGCVFTSPAKAIVDASSFPQQPPMKP